MIETYKSNRNVCYTCHYHVVWCPRISEEGSGAGHRNPLERNHRAEVEELEVMPDHGHVLVSVDPQFGIHRLVKLIKGRSSRLLHQEFPVLKRKLPTLWTNSYFVGTTGGVPLSNIEQQKHV
jgi:putative transposase